MFFLQDSLPSAIDAVSVIQELSCDTVSLVIQDLNEKLVEIEKKIDNQGFWKHVIPIIAVILGGLLALIQIKSNTVSAARIKWNEDLRSALSQYISYLDRFELDVAGLIEQGKSNQVTNSEVVEMASKYTSMTKAEYQVKLLLNPKNQSHSEIIELMEELDNEFGEFTSRKGKHEIPLQSIREKISSKSQTVLKESWEDAKSMNLKEMFFKLRWK